MRLELTYAVTAWTKAVEDEHRLLSQVLAILFSYRRLPSDVIEGQPGGGSRLREAETSVGRPREEKADFWTSVGGSVQGVGRLRGPHRGRVGRDDRARTSGEDPDRSHPARRRDARNAPRSCTASAGPSATSDGEPIADAWVTLPKAGRFAASDREGRFVFDRIEAGSHDVTARGIDGGEASASVKVPGARSIW